MPTAQLKEGEKNNTLEQKHTRTQQSMWDKVLNAGQIRRLRSYRGNLLVATQGQETIFWVKQRGAKVLTKRSD